MMIVKDLYGKKLGADDFVFFWGHTARGAKVVGKQCLSQWYEAPMIIDGVYYNCMEQYLMAEKARTFGDKETEAKIMASHNQMAIKKLGRQVANYDNSVWAAVRQQVSVRGNLHKFTQNSKLKDYLLSTGSRVLVEASPKDQIWGIGVAESDADAAVPARWQGTNLLGFALMEVRRQLRLIEQTLAEIFGRKEESGISRRKEFEEFCQGHKFTTILQWECEGLPFEDIKRKIEDSDAWHADKIMIDMRYGRGFNVLPLMLYEQMHIVLDPVAEHYGFEYIFSLTPDSDLEADDGKVCLTLFA